MDSLFGVESDAPLHASAGGVRRVQCSPLATEVRFDGEWVMFTVRWRSSGIGRCVRHSSCCNLQQELSAYISIRIDRSCPCVSHPRAVLQCYSLIVLQHYTRDPSAPVHWRAAKFKLFRTLATSFIRRHGWISANSFLMESALFLEGGNLVRGSPGAVGRTRWFLITPEVRVHMGGCCSPYVVRILP